jgi:hypothetical protein
MDLKQTMIVFALLLGLILSAPVGVVYGQTPTPTPKTQPQPNLGQTPTIASQCIDINQDRICEAVILANGTLINFTMPTPVQPQPVQQEEDGKCYGGPKFCEPTNLINNCTMPDPLTQCFSRTLKNGTLYFGNGKPSPVEETKAPDAGSIPQNLPYDEEIVEETGDEFVGFDRDGDGDDNGNGKDGDDVNPYCDKLNDEERLSENCWDRKDYYQGGEKDGLYPCNDGSDRRDWRDCPDVSGYDYDNDDNGDEGNNGDDDNGDVREEGEGEIVDDGYIDEDNDGIDDDIEEAEEEATFE